MYSWFTRALEENFEVLRLLKESGRGSVTLLRHRSDGKLFILRRSDGSGEVYRKLLGVRCPNLPEILETVSREGETLVLEEYVRGDNMGALLREALFTPAETRQIGLQLCRALWVLHSLGAVHRDVKPGNVLLRGADAVLIDFDAARLHKAEQQTDTRVLGTTGFAAPEQYGLSQSDPRADIYSMGVLLNTMLTGEHPSVKLAEGRFGRIVTRCTQINPRKRYPNVLRLAEELT